MTRRAGLLCVWPVLDVDAGRDALIAEGVAALEDLAAAVGGRLLGTSTWRLVDADQLPGWEHWPGRLLIATLSATTVITPQGGPVDLQLEPDAEQLLRDVKAGKVARHRRSITAPVAEGEDRQEDPEWQPSGLRRAGARLNVLRAKQLVELPRGEPDVPSWPWKTTKLGDTVIAVLDKKDVGEGRTEEKGDPGE